MRFVLGGQYGLAPEPGHAAAREPLCTCGHERSVHEHLRRGTDCGSCGRDICRAFADAKRTNVIPFHRRITRPAQPAAKAG